MTRYECDECGTEWYELTPIIDGLFCPECGSDLIYEHEDEDKEGSDK